MHGAVQSAAAPSRTVTVEPVAHVPVIAGVGLVKAPSAGVVIVGGPSTVKFRTGVAGLMTPLTIWVAVIICGPGVNALVGVQEYVPAAAQEAVQTILASCRRVTMPPAVQVPVMAGVVLAVTELSAGVVIVGAFAVHMLVGAPEHTRPAAHMPGAPIATAAFAHTFEAVQASVVHGLLSLQSVALVHATQRFEPPEPAMQKGAPDAQPRSVPLAVESRQGSHTGAPDPVTRQ